MHLETLLYMLLQSNETLAPPGPAPDFGKIASVAREATVPNKWFQVPARTINVGLDDPEDDSGLAVYFGWDNEKPRRKAQVPTFEAKARPITIEEYATYLEQTGQDKLPAAWIDSDPPRKGATNGTVTARGAEPKTNGYHVTNEGSIVHTASIRTVYGPVKLKYALDWPVFASYDELLGCAKWMGGRIPSAEEVQSIYQYVDAIDDEQAERYSTQTVSAVNGHLSNGGVEISPPSHPWHAMGSNSERTPDPSQYFTDLEGANVGFKHFHPMPVSPNGNKLAGRGDMGGVWEWTSSVLEKHKGFEAMDLYPAYTGASQPFVLR